MIIRWLKKLIYHKELEFNLKWGGTIDVIDSWITAHKLLYDNTLYVNFKKESSKDILYVITRCYRNGIAKNGKSYIVGLDDDVFQIEIDKDKIYLTIKEIDLKPRTKIEKIGVDKWLKMTLLTYDEYVNNLTAFMFKCDNPSDLLELLNTLEEHLLIT